MFFSSTLYGYGPQDWQLAQDRVCTERSRANQPGVLPCNTVAYARVAGKLNRPVRSDWPGHTMPLFQNVAGAAATAGGDDYGLPH